MSRRPMVLAVAGLAAVAVLAFAGSNGATPIVAPGEDAYRAAQAAVERGAYDEAEGFFNTAARARPGDPATHRGLASVHVRRGAYPAARDAINVAINSEPQNLCNYATRGIIHDHLGQYVRAMEDYSLAVRGCPEAVESVGWWKRILGNVQQRPPTVADRLRYLRAEFRRPPAERRLTRPVSQRK